MREILCPGGRKLFGIANRSPGLVAWGALILTVVIWAAFLVVTRAAMSARLGSIEVGLIRFGTGALLFLPITLRHGLFPKGARIIDMVLIPLFGGVGFILLLSAGLSLAPVADAGVFAPSMLPVYTAILAALFLGETFSQLRLAGFAMIIFGALSIGGWEALRNAGDGVWRGHLCFTGAALVWAVYTISFRRSGLSPAVAGAFMCTWSAVILGCVALVTGVDFTVLSPPALALQVVFQGVLSGFVATFTYFFAIQYFGASRTAAFAAFVPILAALGGWAFLGESLGLVKAAGIAVVAAGVALASGALGGQRVGQG